MKFPPRHLRSKNSSAAAVLLLGICAAATFNATSARAADTITVTMKGKTWPASIFQYVTTLPYVQVASVLDENKPADFSKVKWYYVLPYAGWTVDCKYYHPVVGWSFRGSHIQGITSAGGTFDGYYENGFAWTILADRKKLADVTELCFPGGDAGAPR